MRFADARPDGRAVVYAHIQADPLVAEAADLLADGDDRPAPARAGGDERHVHRSDRLAGDVSDAVRAGRARPGRRRARPLGGHPRRLARASPSAASRPEASTAAPSSRPLTERLLAARTGPVRRERRILFDGRPAEIHPYDVTVEGEAAGRGLGLQVGRARHQGRRHPPARRRAARRRRGRGEAAGRARRVRRPAIVRGPAGARAGPGRARGHPADRARVARPAGGAEARVTDTASNRTGDGPVPRPVRRVRGRRARRGRPRCCATRRTSPGSTPSGWGSTATGTPRAASPGSCARRRSWCCAPVPLGTTLDVSTTVDGFRKVWARRRTDGRLADGTLAFWAHTDWVIVDARGLPTRVPAEFPAVYGDLPGPFEPGRVPLPPTPRRRRRPSRPSCVRRTSIRWATSTTPPTSTTSRRRCSTPGRRQAAAVAAVPRTVCIEYLLQAVPGDRRHGLDLAGRRGGRRGRRMGLAADGRRWRGPRARDARRARRHARHPATDQAADRSAR